MAVSSEKSVQMDRLDAIPPEANPVHEWRGKKRILYFSHTQAVAGDAASIQSLAKLPQGSVRVIADESRVYFSAFGASRVLDIGFAAYTNLDGEAVAADPDFFATDVDVSAAGSALLSEASAKLPLFESLDGVEIESVVAGGTIPAAATLEGYITYVID
jgi:hypothetical protein